MKAGNSDQTNDAVYIDQEWVDALTNFLSACEPSDCPTTKKGKALSLHGENRLFSLVNQYDWTVPVFIPDPDNKLQKALAIAIIDKFQNVLGINLQGKRIRNYCTNLVISMREATKDFLYKRNKNNKFQDAVIEYVVKEWGGINKVAPGQLCTEAKSVIKGCSSVEDVDHIPSLTKVLAANDPEHFFVYDSVVSLALNLIIFDHNHNTQPQFPFLEGRARKIDNIRYNARKIFLLYAQEKDKDFIPRRSKFQYWWYKSYCRLIIEVAKKLGLKEEEYQLVEMALFAYGQSEKERLLDQIEKKKPIKKQGQPK